MKQYIVDAFAEKVFEGNPAAVCILEQWLPEPLMLNITRENNLSETAFAVKKDNHYHLRWFTPGGEIDLCGHATLATAFVIMNYIDTSLNQITFNTLSGELSVTRDGDQYLMAFPAYQLAPVPVTEEITRVIGTEPKEAWMGRDLVCVIDNEEEIYTLVPDLEMAKNLPGLLLHVTAPGKDFECVSRSFAPKLNIDEDPVCGSGHCHIAPLWAEKYQKLDILARQASPRGGTLKCTVSKDQVTLAGSAVLFAVSDLNIPLSDI